MILRRGLLKRRRAWFQSASAPDYSSQTILFIPHSGEIAEGAHQHVFLRPFFLNMLLVRSLGLSGSTARRLEGFAKINRTEVQGFYLLQHLLLGGRKITVDMEEHAGEVD